MEEPNGKDLLQTLITLLADQENVHIVCEITERRKNESEKSAS